MPAGARTIMVGSAGTATSYGIIRSILAAWPDTSIVAIDANPAELVIASMFAKRYAQVSLASKREDYAARILEIAGQYGVDLFIPVHDEEIAVAAELSETSRWPKALRLASSSSATVKLCNDKIATAETLRAHGLPTPETLPVTEASWRKDGWFAKPRSGVGSVGVERLASPEDLKKLQASAPHFIVQEVCVKPEFTIDSFVSRKGNSVFAVARERIEVKAGVCVKARILQHQDYTQLAAKVARAFNLTGAFCFQTMHDAAGHPKITDVNPRTGGATRMCAALGINFPAANVADVLGLDANAYLPPLKGTHIVLRQHEEFVMT